MQFFGKRAVSQASGGLTRRDLDSAVKRIWESGCFDFSFYQMQSARYFKSTPDAIKHYLIYGATQGLNPNRFFDTLWYSKRYAGVKAENNNPLLDYLSRGPQYDRNPSKFFDNFWYISNYLGKNLSTVSPLQHYISTGQYHEYIVSPVAADLAMAPLIPARFTDLFRELVPQDGTFAFSAEFRVEPIPTQRRVSVTGIDDDAEAFDQAFISPPYIAEFETAGIIGGTRLVIVNNTTVLSDEIDAFRRTEEWVAKPRDAHIDSDGTLTLTIHRRYPSKISGGLHLMHEYAANYFHFTIEVLPRLLLADAMKIPDGLPLLVQKGLHPNLLFLLDLVGIHSRPIVELEHRHLYVADRLFFVSDPSSIQDVYHRPRCPSDTILAPGLLRALVDRVVNRMNASQPIARRRRIYLRRGGKRRALLNEHAIEAMLVKFDFELVSTDTLSFETQFWLMRQAAVVVAPTGAALTNMLWCQAGVSICVLAAAHKAMSTEIWMQLGTIINCDVKIIYGELLDERDDVCLHDDYSVDVKALKDHVTEWISRSLS